MHKPPQHSWSTRVSRSSKSGWRRRRPWLEALEERQLLSPVDWISTTSGNWDVGSNWSTGQVPGPNDDVVINVSGATPTVTINSGSVSVNSLMATDPLVIGGGSLALAGTSTISGPFMLSTISTLTTDGTLTLSGSTTWTSGAIEGTGEVENTGSLNVAGSTGESSMLSKHNWRTAARSFKPRARTFAWPTLVRSISQPAAFTISRPTVASPMAAPARPRACSTAGR